MRIISGTYRGKKLVSPTTTATRPTSDRARETIFNILENNPACRPMLWSAMRVADVFAGTGALGLEAISRGAKACVFVENDRQALHVLRENVQSLGVEDRCRIMDGDGTRLSRADDTYDLVFMDPPYGKGFAEKGVQALLNAGWIQSESLVVVEIGKKEDLDVQGTELLVEKIIGAAKIKILRIT